MIEANRRNLGEALKTGRLDPPVAGENHIVFIDKHRIQETELPDARRDLLNLLLRMGSGIPRVRAKRSEGKQFDARHRRSGDARGYASSGIANSHLRLRDHDDAV